MDELTKQQGAAAVAPASSAAEQFLSSHGLLADVLDAAGLRAMVLGADRQLLFASHQLLELGAVETLAQLLGKGPGDALGCINAEGQPCGTSPLCEECSTNRVLLQCQQSGEQQQRSCVLTVRQPHGLDSLEFRVRASTLRLGGEPLTLLTLRDISSERRREALERVFFHDILNTITGLYGHVTLLAEDPTAQDAPAIIGRVVRICDRLRREVQDQRALGRAESGYLEPEVRPVDPSVILESVAQFFGGHVAVSGKQFRVEHAEGLPRIHTDASLVVRVLINMVKNAFEATRAGDTIRLSSAPHGDGCLFAVWNPGVIPADVARKIFRRSFSTKGQAGRGLGTYSMKLFGERYLGGEVGFTTSEQEGTRFFIALPARAPEG